MRLLIATILLTAISAAGATAARKFMTLSASAKKPA
jgi:hypothetical protein